MTTAEAVSIELSFEDNRVLPILYGPHNANLTRIEYQLGVTLAPRGNALVIHGPDGAAGQAATVLKTLWDRASRGHEVASADVDTAIRFTHADAADGSASVGPADAWTRGTIQTRRRVIAPRTPTQLVYAEALRTHELVFALGPAGTGKTYLAVAQAVSLLNSGQVDRIILSRPAVEAGERLGFLPGDLREKVDPYLRPLYDALYDMMPAEQVARGLDTGTIEVAPLAFMRGRTLANAFVILDEAQNSTGVQMRMFLTRLGENSRMAVTGDPSQTDLPPAERSGLTQALEVLKGVDGVAQVRFTDRDVVRHPLVTRIVRAYQAADERNRQPGRRA
ncbi:MAG: PhoH family protein [Rhodospirillaceae bacterium]|nr:PhoH family protein [Rhodospirillaceae bacterium]